MKIKPDTHTIRWGIAALLIWGYAFSRALTLSFTHEESLSYNVIMGDQWRSGTSNNHYLNTWWMNLSGSLFGYSEISLRIGSLVAFSLYLWGGVWLLLQSKSTSVRLAGFSLLFLNPFMLDFFGVARGYSWALAGGMGMMVALYHLSAEGRGQTSMRADRWCIFGLASVMVAVLGNLTMINMLVPFVLLLLLQHIWSKRSWKVNYLTTIPVALALGGTLFYILKEISRMQRNTELYYGSVTEFFRGTLGSLTFATLYRAIYTQAALEMVLYTVFMTAIVASALALFGWRRKGPVGFFTLIGTLALLTVGWIFLQRFLWRTPLPLEHTAVFLVPLFGMLLFSGISTLHRHSKPFWSEMAPDFARIISLILIFHFAHTANLQHTFTWHFDQHTREAIMQLAGARDQYPADRPVKLAAHGLFEPALNYYRQSRKLDWLEPIPGDGIKNKDADVYYTLWDDAANIPNREGMKEITTYDATRSSVWKR